jgi:anti-sigma-K factor RskA
MNAVNKEAPERQEIEALLPWHAAGTLSRRDRERIERAIANDSELARRLTLVREELQETIHLNESLGTPSTRAAEKLFAAIDAEGSRAPARRPFDLAGRFAALVASFTPRTVAYAAGAAALAIVVQGAVLTTMVVKDQAGGEYGLASATSTEPPLVVVRFAPQATSLDITKFLDAYKAEVVAGPKKGNFYHLRLTKLPSETEIAGVIRQMQSESKIVDFVAAKE